MDSLPEALQWKIMMYNRHPCAEMMHGLFKSYHEVLQIQAKSKNFHFTILPSPTFFEWKVHGIGFEEWAQMFEIRELYLSAIDPLDALDNHVNGDGKVFRRIKMWKEERAQLQLREYHF
jgi:hypothetical protein